MASEDSASGGGFTVKMSFANANLSEQWRLFKRQLNYYFDSKFTVNQLTDRRKVGVLMTALGREGVEILDTLFPANEQPSFDEIVRKFDDYCNPKKNTVFERSVYFRLVQKPEQSIDMFILALKKQAALCEFVKEEHDKLIRDVLVIGIRDAKLREELLRDPDLDLQKAIQACKARERSRTEASQIAAFGESSLSVDQLANRPRSAVDRRPPPCPNCSYLHGNIRPCPALKAACKNCGRMGHFIKMCRSKPAPKAVRAIEQQPTAPNVDDDHQESVDLLKVYGCRSASVSSDDDNEKAWYVDLPIGNTICKFKLDTAAECDTLSERSYNLLSPRPTLFPSRNIIKPYHAPAFRPLGKIVAWYQEHRLEFLIMPEDEENLLGFQTCKRLQLVKRVSAISAFMSRESFVATNADSFQGVGKIPGQHKIYLDPLISPRASRPRRFAYALLEKIKSTILEMHRQDIIEPVSEPTPWISNITIVEKADGTLRICLDPQSLNKAIQVPKYIIPKPDDILVQLANKRIFTVIDLKSGFWHMELDPASAKLTTFNSPLGRYCFKRLCFGINCAPEMFMAEMVRIFGEIPNVCPYFDDLIIATETEDEHDAALSLVCARAREYNIKFNLEKLQYKQATVQFLGLILSASGVQPAPKHVRAMLKLPQPADKLAVLRFLGLIKFLARFIPNVSQLTANLRNLTHNDTEFQWTPAHESEFQNLKQVVASAPVLVFFNASKPIIIQTDSSKDGLGSVLLQQDRPVAFASRALTKAEVRYSQIEKELLAIVFACERFHEYIYGQQVTVHSDHRPLESILRKDLDKVSSRLQRLRLRLLKYNVVVQYVPGKNLLVADALSRAYLPDEVPNLEYQSVTVHTVKSLAISQQKAEQIAAETQADPILAPLRQRVETDQWPATAAALPPDQVRFFAIRSSLSVLDNLLFFENRLVIPSSLRQYFLTKLHEGHLGVEKTKRLARETVYWPGMTTDIANFVQSCQVCQKFAKNNTKQPLYQYPIPTYPWQQLAIDIATFDETDFLVVVDKYSNWPEALQLKSKTAVEVISHLQKLFARYGIPESIVSDNNPFNSAAYLAFAEEWGFQPLFTSPHYPQANGHAERTVQTVKMLLRKSLAEKASFHYALLQHRNTPIADTGFSPAQVLLGRRLRTKLPIASALLIPRSVPQDVIVANKEKNRAVQQYYFDKSSMELPPLTQSQPVWVKDTPADRQWQPATIQQVGPTPRSFVVEKEEGGTVVRNRRFLRPRTTLVRPARFRD